MNQKRFWLKSFVILSAMLALSLGYIQAQLTGYIPVFVDELGTEDVSVIFQNLTTGNIGIGTTDPGVAKLRVVTVSPISVLGLVIDPTGDNTGVYGQTDSSGDRTAGVFGVATATRGSTTGVWGRSVSSSNDASGVFGEATASSGNTTGVWGRSFSSSNDAAGVRGEGRIGFFGHGTSVGVLGSAPGGSLAGVFLGNVTINGTLSKSAGSFQIDHPLDPANKYLYHSFVESPDMKNIYDGVVVLDDRGEAVVSLPDWFEALNRDFRYQLTCIGGFAPVYVAQKIADNRFKTAGGQPSLEVSWQVTGIRHDPYAEKHRIPVEEDKAPEDKGFYLIPEVYGQPKTKGIGWNRHGKFMKEDETKTEEQIIERNKQVNAPDEPEKK